MSAELPTTPETAAHCGMTPADYLEVIGDLLPIGAAWPRDPETVLMRFWGALADEWARIHARDCDLIAEAYPCGSHELLADWERVVGLPDECTEGMALSESARQAAVCAKLGETGGQSVNYYVELAARWGYTISVEEFWPWRIGTLPLCDGLLLGMPGHWWEVTVPSLPVHYVTVGCWRLGEPIAVILGQELLECLIRRAAPAHTIPDFSYRLRKRGWNKAGWNLDAWT
jgi:uncharacterized protein YmfQ (DUF2313 family)